VESHYKTTYNINIPPNRVYMDAYGDEDSVELKKLLIEVVSRQATLGWLAAD